MTIEKQSVLPEYMLWAAVLLIVLALWGEDIDLQHAHQFPDCKERLSLRSTPVHTFVLAVNVVI